MITLILALLLSALHLAVHFIGGMGIALLIFMALGWVNVSLNYESDTKVEK